MKQKEAPTTKREFLGEEQRFQRETLAKYRRQGILPPVTDIVIGSGAKTSTVNMFMWGNSRNEMIRSWMRKRFHANFKTLPQDLAELLAIWDQT